MARLLEIEEKELLTIWLADKVLDAVEGEDEVKRDAVIYAQREKLELEFPSLRTTTFPQF